MKLEAIFFDRDGVLNVDHGYVHRKADWQWTPGALDALKLLRRAGVLIIVVTNQSGVGRGFYGEEQVRELHEWVNAETGGLIDAFYYCPHGPGEDCLCRKPKPGMIEAALRDWKLDPSNCHLIGDKESDLAAARAAGVASSRYDGGNLLLLVQRIFLEQT